MERKLYKCEIPGCDSQVPIRSTIKSGKHKGKKACTGCKHRIEGNHKPRSPLKAFNPKTKEKRKAERVGLPKFFEDGIELLKRSPWCMECGIKINVNYEPITNIAHILPKATYKSVMAHPLNKIFLCSHKDNPDGRSCHYNFDNNILEIPNMRCYNEVKARFELFKHEVVERGRHYSIIDEN